MNKSCPRCKHITNGGQDNPIPREIPLPLGLSFSIDEYFPEVLKPYKNYRMFICQYCGYVEFFVS
jgi:hypothetical protein